MNKHTRSGLRQQRVRLDLNPRRGTSPGPARAHLRSRKQKTPQDAAPRLSTGDVPEAGAAPSVPVSRGTERPRHRHPGHRAAAPGDAAGLIAQAGASRVPGLSRSDSSTCSENVDLQTWVASATRCWLLYIFLNREWQEERGRLQGCERRGTASPGHRPRHRRPAPHRRCCWGQRHCGSPGGSARGDGRPGKPLDALGKSPLPGPHEVTEQRTGGWPRPRPGHLLPNPSLQPEPQTWGDLPELNHINDGFSIKCKCYANLGAENTVHP